MEMWLRSIALKIAVLNCLLLVGCGDEKSSQPITLYRESISSGNSIVSFVNHNDPEGITATSYCEIFRQAYEKKYPEKYFCVPLVFQEFKPDVKWRVPQ
jgi:hypothetical protein